MTQALAEKLKHTGPGKKKKSCLRAREKAVGKYAGAAFAKRERNKAVSPKHQIVKSERIDDKREPYLGDSNFSRSGIETEVGAE